MKLVSSRKYPKVIGVRDVRVLTGHSVHITFTDGSERDIDLEPHLWGPVFESIRRDPELFASVFVDPIGHTLAWPNDVDLAPETLYYGDSPPPWMAEDSTPKRQSSLPRIPRSTRSKRKRTRSRA
ncbi:MAG: DUF2442 domain-containing protein [Chloroflexi bacterium]|nr:DUF2442 domain-containing protein [Chloroflexota bacterium]